MKRRILTLCLALVLIISMALPAFAAQSSGTYVYNGTSYTYTYTALRNSTYATASISIPSSSIYVEANVKATVPYDGKDYYTYGYGGGYSSASSRAGNTITIIGGTVTASIISCRGDYYIFDQWVTYLTTT